jgi:hypothetical protein
MIVRHFQHGEQRCRQHRPSHHAPGTYRRRDEAEQDPLVKEIDGASPDPIKPNVQKKANLQGLFAGVAWLPARL